MAIVMNPATGAILVTEDPTGYLSQGWRIPTDEEADEAARNLDFGTFGQQAQAQAERVVRGATLGAVEGFGGDEEEIRARAEVSREQSPITSFAADVLPDVAVGLATGGVGGLATAGGRAAAGAALRGGAGLARAGMAAGRAGGAAALAGESLGSGAVGAAQIAFEQDREFLSENPGEDAENILLWGGLNFGIGSAVMARQARKASKLTRAEVEAGAEELDEIAAAAEVEASLADHAPAEARDIPDPFAPASDLPQPGAAGPITPQGIQRIEPPVGPEALPGVGPGTVAPPQPFSDLSPAGPGAEVLPAPKAVEGAPMSYAEALAGLGPSRRIADPMAPTGIESLTPARTLDVEGSMEAAPPVAAAADSADPLQEAVEEGVQPTLEDLSREFNKIAGLRTAGDAPPSGLNVQLRGDDGYLEPALADDPRLEQVRPEIEAFAESGIAGSSLKDLKALPLTSKGERKMIARLKKDETFLKTGNVKDNHGRQRGGLPSISIYPEGVSLGNGRHRLTAARESGLESIVFNVKKYDEQGETLWDYVGPVKIGRELVDKPPGKAKAADYLAEQLTEPLGITPGGFYRGSDGVERYVKFLPDDEAAHEVAAAAAYNELGVEHLQPHQFKAEKWDTPEHWAKGNQRLLDTGYTQEQIDAMTENPRAKAWRAGIASQKLGPEWKTIGEVGKAGQQLPPEVAREYVRGVPADILLGNWDVAGKGDNVMTNGKKLLRVDAGRSGIATINDFDAGEEWAKLEARVKEAESKLMTQREDLAAGDPDPFVPGRVAHEPQDLISHTLLPENFGAIKGELQQGLQGIEQAMKQAGGVEGFVKKRFASLKPKEQKELARSMASRLEFLRHNIDKISIVAAAGGGAALVGEEDGAALAAGGLLPLLLGRRGLGFKRVAKEATESGVSRAVSRATKAESDDLAKRAMAKEPTATERSSFGRQRRLYQNRDAVLDVAVREMQRDLTDVMKDVRRVAMDEKASHVSRHVGDNDTAQRAAVKTAAKDAAKLAGQLRAEAKAIAAGEGRKGLQFPVQGEKKLVEADMDHGKKIQEATGGRGMFEALDEFKRVLDDFKVNLEKGADNSENPIYHHALIPKVEGLAHSIRRELESGTTWGKAGEMQAAYNSVIHDRLLPSMRVFEEAVLERTHRGYDASWNVEGWERKIASLLKGGDAGKRRHVNAVLDAMAELASARGRFGDKSTAKSMGERVDQIRRAMGLAEEVQAATVRMQAAGELLGGGGPWSGAVAGGLVAGLPGAAAGAALPGMVRSAIMGDLAANIRKLTGATDAAVDRSVDDWIRSSRVRGGGVTGRLRKKLEMSDDARHLAEVAKRRGVTHSLALFMGEDESVLQAFERARDALQDDEAFFQELGQDYQELAQQSPEVFMALSARASDLRDLLRERMPPNVAVSLANPLGHPPSREAIEDWAIYWNAVRHPKRTIENLASIRVQELEVLRRGYPRAYERIESSVIQKIAAARASGEPLDDTLLMRLDLLFDLDGAGSPAFSREVADTVRAYNQGKAQGAAPTGGAPGGRPKQTATPGSIQGVAATGATFGQGF